MGKGVVISLYDFTGEACRPWAEAGHQCFCFDIQHDGSRVETVQGWRGDLLQLR
jgi:hypothetical protein